MLCPNPLSPAVQRSRRRSGSPLPPRGGGRCQAGRGGLRSRLTGVLSLGERGGPLCHSVTSPPLCGGRWDPTRSEDAWEHQLADRFPGRRVPRRHHPLSPDATRFWDSSPRSRECNRARRSRLARPNHGGDTWRAQTTGPECARDDCRDGRCCVGRPRPAWARARSRWSAAATMTTTASPRRPRSRSRPSSRRNRLSSRPSPQPRSSSRRPSPRPATTHPDRRAAAHLRLIGPGLVRRFPDLRLQGLPAQPQLLSDADPVLQ